MKLSLWQQFSSNHSGDFTDVGTFESPEQANKAAEVVRQILRTIQSWYYDPKNSETINAILEDANQNGGSPPMPIEVEFGKQYGFEWDEQAPDSLWYQESPDAAKAVTVLDQHVFIENLLTDARTWSGAFPLLQLLEQLGAKALMQDSLRYDAFWMQLKCDAPNEETALGIEKNYLCAQDLDCVDSANIVREFWLSGELHRTGTVLEFRIEERMGFLGEDIPAMIGYLREQGCTKIEYTFMAGNLFEYD